jgi:hypothetical protein
MYCSEPLESIVLLQKKYKKRKSQKKNFFDLIKKNIFKILNGNSLGRVKVTVLFMEIKITHFKRN